MRLDEAPAQFRERFVRSFLDWVMISMLHRKPTRGHEIIVSIGDEYRVYVSPGSLYPILHNLERTGLVRVEPFEPGAKLRKVYRLTEAGNRAFLDGLETLGGVLDSLRRS